MKKSLLGKKILNDGGGAVRGQKLVPISYSNINWAKK